jgi:hypothetical protein
LDEEVTSIIKETAVSIEERYPFEMEALGTDKNHIHVLCTAHPKVAPGRFVQMFKSITAREIFRRQPAIKQDLWGGDFGQMAITWPQWESGPTGKWWNAMSNVKVTPKKTSNSLDSSNSLIPRQLAAGVFIQMQTFEKWHWSRGIGDSVFDRFQIVSSLLGFQSFAGISPSMVS